MVTHFLHFPDVDRFLVDVNRAVHDKSTKCLFIFTVQQTVIVDCIVAWLFQVSTNKQLH